MLKWTSTLVRDVVGKDEGGGWGGVVGRWRKGRGRVRHAFMPTEAESILVEAESHVGFFLASTRLPWIFHGLERWASPGKPEKFLERLPWVHRLLLEYWWEPVYLRCNWLLLQSLADPVEEDKL
ncbi:unnamed protein product [Closterium sp. Naga37s-1]|nr:unnamed protein product [Closterium sp. Naga37s-1]